MAPVTRRRLGGLLRPWMLVALLLASPLAAGAVLILVITLGLAGSAAGAAPAAVPGIPPLMLQAYTQAAARAPQIAPGCQGVRWSILAGIAQIESGQAEGHQISDTGAITPPIIGPRLDGSGAGGNTTAIKDTDGGRWDGDTAYDHAVGPFQFLPSSWLIYGQDANQDRVKDPDNTFDAAAAAVAHLCGPGHQNLTDPGQLRKALLGYNNSDSYVAEVQRWIAQFDQAGAITTQASASGTIASCAGGTTASYPNGQIPLEVLCPLWQAPGQHLQAGAAAAFDRLSHAYADHFGQPICVTDSYRSLAEQVKVRALKPGLAAVPGTSNHGWGTAVDLCGGAERFGTAQHSWLMASAPAFGWVDPGWARATGSKPEPWHWEFIG